MDPVKLLYVKIIKFLSAFFNYFGENHKLYRAGNEIPGKDLDQLSVFVAVATRHSKSPISGILFCCTKNKQAFFLLKKCCRGENKKNYRSVVSWASWFWSTMANSRAQKLDGNTKRKRYKQALFVPLTLRVFIQFLHCQPS